MKKADREKSLIFTMHWSGDSEETQERWLGHNVTVRLMHPDHETSTSLESKPAS